MTGDSSNPGAVHALDLPDCYTEPARRWLPLFGRLTAQPARPMRGCVSSIVPAGRGNGCVATPTIAALPSRAGPGETARSFFRRRRRIPHEGCSFAEDPALSAREARIFFERRTDPHVLPCEAVPGAIGERDLLRTGCFSAMLLGEDPAEQVLFSDGLHNLRLEVQRGTLRAGPVQLRFRFEGLIGVEAPLLTFRRLVAFHRLGRMPRQLYPRDPRIERSILSLRAWDAHCAGASQREIAAALFGKADSDRAWDGPSDYLHSRVKRLLHAARGMVRGDWRRLLRGKD